MLIVMTADRQDPYDGTVQESFTFRWDDVDSEYIVHNIDGLGPVKSNLGFLNKAQEPGALYVGSRDEVRNIVLTIGFSPDYAAGSTISKLRQDLKKVFMTGSRVYLEFFDDSQPTWVKINGVVETHEPSIFSSEPEVKISIMCGDPYFNLNLGTQTYDIPIEEVFVTHDFLTEVPTPLALEVTFTTEVSSFSIQSLSGFWFWLVNTTFFASDTLYISSIENKVEHTSFGSTESRLDVFSGEFSAGRLHQGENTFIINDTNNAQVITYERLVGGL